MTAFNEISGVLDRTQFPDAIVSDGSRGLTGNLGALDGVTIDGVDISVLSINYNAHLASRLAHDYVSGITDDAGNEVVKDAQNRTRIYGDEGVSVTKTSNGLMISVSGGSGGGGSFAFSGIKDTLGAAAIPDSLGFIQLIGSDHIAIDNDGHTLVFTLNTNQIMHSQLGGKTKHDHHTAFVGLKVDTTTVVPDASDVITLVAGSNLLLTTSTGQITLAVSSTPSFNSLTVTGDIIVSGSVDGVDISTLNTNFLTAQTDIDTLQSDVTTLSLSLSTHTGSTSEHGATGAVVGTTNTQSLTNKTLVSPMFSPATVTAPFTLSVKGQGQTVVGLKADQLNKSVNAGTGMTGGGTLASDVTLGVNTDHDFAWTGDHSWSGKITFGSSARQMIELYSSTYAIGVQGNTLYLRTNSRFSIHLGGVYSVTENDPGAGGTNLFTLTTSIITYKGNAIWHAGNDGSGSTLDADLLDGLNSTDFVRLGPVLLSTAQVPVDWWTTPAHLSVSVNSTSSTGYPTVYGATWSFRGNPGVVSNSAYNRSFDLHLTSTNTLDLYARTYNSDGTPTSWYKLWNAYNDGAGSGLDADLWDGYQFSDYINQAVRTTDTPTFAGATLTGFTQITRTAEQLRLRYDVNNYAVFSVGTASLTLAVRGSGSVVGSLTLDVENVYPYAALSTNLGSNTQKYLTLHAAELWVDTLVAQDKIATVGGRILVGSTTKLTRDMLAAATYMYVEHNGLASGDFVYLEGSGKLEFVKVNSTPTTMAEGDYRYTVLRNQDASGANDWYAGDAVFNTGTTGDGWIDMYAISSMVGASQTGPTIVGNVRTGTTWALWKPRWAVGNLNGIYGYGADTYGAAFGDPDATNVTIDNVNGFRVRKSGTTVVSSWDTSGNIVLGDASIENVQLTTTGVYLRNGGTAYTSLVDTTLTLGPSNGDRLVVSSTQIQFLTGASQVEATFDANSIALGRTTSMQTLITSTGITVGDAAGENVYIDSAGVYLRNSTTVYTGLSGTTLTLGPGTGDRVEITSTDIRFKTASTTEMIIDANSITIGASAQQLIITNTTITLGDDAGEHLSITSSGIDFKNSTSVLGTLTSTAWVLGATGSNNINITSSAIQFRSGSDVYGELGATSLKLGRTANSHARIEVDPTNGIRLISRSAGGVDTTVVSLTTVGNATFSGTVSGSTITGSTIIAGAGSELTINGTVGIKMVLGDTSLSRVSWYDGATEVSFITSTTSLGNVVTTLRAAGRSATYDSASITLSTSDYAQVYNGYLTITSSDVASTMTVSANLITLNATNTVVAGILQVYSQIVLNGNMQLDGYVRGAPATPWLQINTGHGYVNIGPQNTSWMHFYTDRAGYYFDKWISVGGDKISSYSGDFLVQRATVTKLTLTTSGVSVTGALTVSSGATITGNVQADSMYITPGAGLGIGVAATSIDGIKLSNSYSPNSTLTSINSLLTVDDGTLTSNRVHYGISNYMYNNYRNADAYTNTIFVGANTLRNSATDNGAASAPIVYLSYNYMINYASDVTYSNVDTLYGVHNYLRMYRAGTGGNWFGTYNHIQVEAGTVDTGYGTYIRMNRDGGTLTTAYGIYMSFEGTIGTKWGIYSVGDTKNYLAGALGLGVDAGAYKLNVTGSSLFTGDQTVTGIMTVNGTLVVPDGGTVTTPSIYFEGDANTGFYRDVADSWRLVAGGVAAIDITSTLVNINVTMGTWANLTYASGWAAYGTPYGIIQYKKVGDIVFVRGFANSAANAWATYPTIATLPSGFRPPSGRRMIFSTVANNSVFARVDILDTGVIQWVSGGSGSGWISLDNIAFSIV